MKTTNQKPKSIKRHARRAGFTLDEIFNLTKIDRWFLTQIKELVDFEEELTEAKNEERRKHVILSYHLCELTAFAS